MTTPLQTKVARLRLMTDLITELAPIGERMRQLDEERERLRPGRDVLVRRLRNETDASLSRIAETAGMSISNVKALIRNAP